MILALYLRLSKEDGDMADESNSITNQRYILQKYVNQNLEFAEFQKKEYVDDGYSGRNFERPGIKELLQDVKAGKIYGIIVKDFSRFGRNYIEVGDYIEKIFPLLDIRFIAVNNYFDSNDYVGTTPDMDVSFQNLMYDYFSAENSMKIKNELFNRRKRGNYLAVLPPFGYIKSPDNHNKLIIDPETAPIVRLIFEKYAEYGVKAEVARHLNKKEILTPQKYALERGWIKAYKYKEEQKVWTGAIVGKILRNSCYIGNTVFHKSEAIEPAAKERKYIPETKWHICENTHEAIISKEMFEWINSSEFLEEVKKRTVDCKNDQKKDVNRIENYNSQIYCEGEQRRRGRKDSPIKGVVKCGGCRHNMIRRNRLNASYYCRYYYEQKLDNCCSVNIKEVDLTEVVKASISRQAALLGERAALLKLEREIQETKEKKLKLASAELQKKICECKDKNFLLYERYKSGELEQGEFQELRQKSLKKIAFYQEQLENYNKMIEKKEGGKSRLFDLFEGKENIGELTRETVDELISCIYVYGKNKVEIVFNFEDEMKALLESTKKTDIQENNKKVVSLP